MARPSVFESAGGTPVSRWWRDGLREAGPA
jgi:hypothetical protein